MLRVLMLQKELREKKAELEKAQAERDALSTREAELEKDIDAAQTDEEKTAVNDAISEFERDKEENGKKIGDLEKRVGEIEAEIAEAEKKQGEADEPEAEPQKREAKKMETRTFFGLSAAETRALFENEAVKRFNENMRTAIKEKRVISGADLTIPEEYLALIRQNIQNYSKLMKYVTVRPISGNANEPVMGTYPEGVWTQMCANLNELDLSFTAVEMTGFKVGGFFSICKAVAEDSDFNFATELITALGQGIGYALDKAIVFGLGTRMPLGFFTRLAQTVKPADYSENEREWEDLHTTHIVKTNATGVQLFQALVEDSGLCDSKYAKAEKVWIMNDKTKTYLKAQALGFDAAGAIVTGINNTLPVVGGDMVVLDFMPDNVIAGGYLDLFALGERKGIEVEESRHVRFLNDEIVWKGTARYDGKPVIAESFVAIGVKNTTPSAAGVTFPPDRANTTPSQS